MTLGENLQNAEEKARIRDFENERNNQFSSEDLQTANELAEKASKQRMRLVPERKVKNRAKFVQIIQQNIMYLQRVKYLSNAEKVFLLDISGYVGFLSNCIVDDVNLKNPVPMTQTDLANAIGRYKTKVSPIINSLIDKGVMARSESGLDDNNVRAYALFVNPNIMFSGNRDDVNPTLKAMFKKVPKDLKNLPIKLF
ncbi:MarR family transcriptional regulator [Peribacillus sp. NPDC096448]|uniref:MarR family transcriptional regulator n=1 Tax=Peribacillus sp. NPDC096448 TaxID=3364395 RepID=UPI0037F26BFA